jgi:hypothetical protein
MFLLTITNGNCDGISIISNFYKNIKDKKITKILLAFPSENTTSQCFVIEFSTVIQTLIG